MSEIPKKLNMYFIFLRIKLFFFFQTKSRTCTLLYHLHYLLIYTLTQYCTFLVHDIYLTALVTLQIRIDNKKEYKLIVK